MERFFSFLQFWGILSLRVAGLLLPDTKEMAGNFCFGKNRQAGARMHTQTHKWKSYQGSPLYSFSFSFLFFSPWYCLKLEEIGEEESRLTDGSDNRAGFTAPGDSWQQDMSRAKKNPLIVPNSNRFRYLHLIYLKTHVIMLPGRKCSLHLRWHQSPLTVSKPCYQHFSWFAFGLHRNIVLLCFVFLNRLISQDEFKHDDREDKSTHPALRISVTYSAHTQWKPEDLRLNFHTQHATTCELWAEPADQAQTHTK